jgi:hypothetical protein
MLELSLSVCQIRQEQVAMDKHSSLLRKFVNYEQKSFITLGPGDNFMKLFTSGI